MDLVPGIGLAEWSALAVCTRNLAGSGLVNGHDRGLCLVVVATGDHPAATAQSAVLGPLDGLGRTLVLGRLDGGGLRRLVV